MSKVFRDLEKEFITVAEKIKTLSNDMYDMHEGQGNFQMPELKKVPFTSVLMVGLAIFLCVHQKSGNDSIDLAMASNALMTWRIIRSDLIN